MKKLSDGKTHRFGGDWTDAKLAVIAGYLRAYTTSLQSQPTKQRPFRKAYIDAFAGTGYRESRGAADCVAKDLLFPDLASSEPQALLEGSARIALKVRPSFDRYIFIERSPRRCASLEELKDEFPELAADIVVRQGDANTEIRTLCSKDWRSSRAVLFLDPYGMQVEWDTIAAIAGTKAIDMWLLFPLGIGVNRLLKKSGDIPESWRHRLDMLLGTRDWFERFYEPRRALLFTDEREQVKTASTETIGRYFVERLRTIFPGVSDQPMVLSNSAGNPLYLLCFAAGNEKGARVALRIADHLLTRGAN